MLPELLWQADICKLKTWKTNEKVWYDSLIWDATDGVQLTKLYPSRSQQHIQRLQKLFKTDSKLLNSLYNTHYRSLKIKKYSELLQKNMKNVLGQFFESLPQQDCFAEHRIKSIAHVASSAAKSQASLSHIRIEDKSLVDKPNSVPSVVNWNIHNWAVFFDDQLESKTKMYEHQWLQL